MDGKDDFRGASGPGNVDGKTLIPSSIACPHILDYEVTQIVGYPAISTGEKEKNHKLAWDHLRVRLHLQFLT